MRETDYACDPTEATSSVSFRLAEAADYPFRREISLLA